MRRLIVNADDFGLTSGVNRGILRAYRDGIVTSTTLMACGLQFDHAIALAKESNGLSIGCHVVLVDGAPICGQHQVSTLLADSGPRFRQTLTSFAVRATTRRLNEDQIAEEVTAQIRKLQAAGIRVSHVDTHKHTHIFPIALRGILRASQACGVRAIRNPFEPLVFAISGNWRRQLQIGILRRYRSKFRDELARAGMVTPDGCVGIIATGGLTPKLFQMLLRNLPEGTWEFVSHPGYNDSELDSVVTRLRDSREMELEILTAPGMKRFLENVGIQLISYDDLTAA